MTELSVDPRVARTRHDVLSAAREVLVEEGWERVTLGRVAERSGYARTTLYRHWPQRLDLLRDLIREEGRLSHTSPTGVLRADLVAELEAFRMAIATTGFGRMIVAVAHQARDDAELAQLNRAMRVEGARVLDAIVVDGVQRGELPSDLRADAAMANLVGPVLYRYLFEDDEALDTEFVVFVVDWFLAAARRADGGAHAGSNSFAVERSQRPQGSPRQGGPRRTNEQP
jgi:AcrR family transcriptional regulator